MKTFFTVILAGLVGLLIWGIVSSLRDPGRLKMPVSETYADKVSRYRVGADHELRSACTNAVTGLRFIVDTQASTSADNFMTWTATATVEYINHLGGVDRTNLAFKASSIGEQFYWSRK